jgi:hypothetical protein
MDERMDERKCGTSSDRREVDYLMLYIIVALSG